VKILCEPLCGNIVLKQINLAGNQLTDNGCQSIAGNHHCVRFWLTVTDVILLNKVLTSIILDNNNLIQFNGAAVIDKALTDAGVTSPVTVLTLKSTFKLEDKLKNNKMRKERVPNINTALSNGTTDLLLFT
jgi:hypothetical protein